MLNLLMQTHPNAQTTEIVNLTIAYSNAVTSYVVEFAHKMVPITVYVLTFMIIPIVWISKVKGNGGLMECTKYITKPSAYQNGKILEILDQQLHRIQSYSCGGKIKVSQEDLDKIDQGKKFKDQKRQGKPNFKIVWKENNWNVK